MSDFIEKSKHAELTKTVSDHFFGSKASELPPPKVEYPFNPETGVNYTPPENAGHKS